MVNQSVANLEAEMKLLRWHKLANESALKAAILKNKKVKQKEKSILRLPYNINGRLNEVVKEERSKELITDESFVQRYREIELKDEAHEQRRLTVQSKRLDLLQQKLEDLETSRSRKLRCSSMKSLMQKEFTSENGNTNSRGDENDFVEVDSEEELEMTRERSQSASERISRIGQQLLRPSIVERTKLHFSQYQAKTHAREPTKTFYSVRISKGNGGEKEEECL